MAEGWSAPTPLRNSDFKALLATPRPAHAGGGGKPKHRGYANDGDEEAEERKPRFKKPSKGKPVKAKEGKDDEHQYRDRARERREGVSLDYDEQQAELAARGLGAATLAGLSIEQSKFLGGDLAHTHLVKGLDYALLQQERQKLDTDVTKQQQQPDGGGESAGGEASATAKAAGAGRLLMPRGLQPEAAAVFHSSSARALYDALFRSHAAARRSLAREAFAPRRTAFVYEFMDGAGDVPTTLRRSKADCPAAEDSVCAVVDVAVLGRVSHILGYLGGGGKAGKRGARDAAYIKAVLSGVGVPGGAAAGEQVHGQLLLKGQAAAAAAGGGGAPGTDASGVPAAAAAAAAAADDDDIFGEAGTDYAPALPAKKTTGAGSDNGSSSQPGVGGGKYFADKSHLDDLAAPHPRAGTSLGTTDGAEEGELLPGSSSYGVHTGAGAGFPGPPPSSSSSGGWTGAAAAAEVPKWRVSTRPGAELKGFADEAYEDCFPSMTDYGGDDDDEPERKGKGADAADGEGAAGKGSGRAGRGGGGGGMDDAERKLSAKLNREVHQIQGIFAEKGWGSEAAFKKPDKLDAVVATPARKRIRL